ncbi:MAG: DoxX family protein [Acidimicrobiia bacterium]|nr:DoxX family protein [Acidimicrobiia bacterium]
MNSALWIVQIVLALAFLASGSMRIMKTHGDLIDSGMEYAEDFSPNSVNAIGAIEIVAAIGLVLPPAVDVLPNLAAFAAAGLVVIMIGAAIVHVRRKEYMPSLLINAVLGGLALFVAIGRFGDYAF